MRRRLLGILAIALGAYVALCAGLFAFQRSLIYFPQGRAVTAAQSTLTLPVDGAKLVVTVRPHVGPKAIIYFGGNAEDVSLNLASFSAAFPDYALYLLHYRGYGGSTGKPTEAANNSDAEALFRLVHAEHPEVVIIGRSLGTGVAIRLASEAPASRLVLVTPYDSLAEIAAASFPYVPVKWLLLDRYDSGRYAGLIKIPTTLIAAENDTVIPGASTAKLMRRFAPGVASFTMIQGAGHNDLRGRVDYERALQAAAQ